MIFLARYGIYSVPLFLIYFWLKESKKKAVFLFASAMIGWLFAWIITLFYVHPRPFVLHLGKLLLPYKPDASFPSDHATVLSAVAAGLFFLGENRPGLLFLLVDFLVGFARIYCGLHFPFDIGGGFLVGFAGSCLAWFLVFRSLIDKGAVKRLQSG